MGVNLLTSPLKQSFAFWIIAALRDSGYDGDIGHESLPAGDPLSALRKAVTACGEAQPC